MTRERAVEILKGELAWNKNLSTEQDTEWQGALQFAIEELEKGKPGVWEKCHDPAWVIHPGTLPKEETPK